jgi:hypothetical protein
MTANFYLACYEIIFFTFWPAAVFDDTQINKNKAAQTQHAIK